MEINELRMKEIIKRLDIIINLLLNQIANPENQMSIVERVRYLDSMGLPPSDIGKVMGKATNYVTAILTQTKKSKGRKARG